MSAPAPLRVTAALIAFHAERARALRAAEFHARIAQLWRFLWGPRRAAIRATPCPEAF